MLTINHAQTNSAAYITNNSSTVTNQVKTDSHQLTANKAENIAQQVANLEPSSLMNLFSTPKIGYVDALNLIG